MTVRSKSRLLAASAALMFAFCASARADDVPAGIKLQERGHGWILTDEQGMTLYTYTRDVTPGKSACVQQCAQQWPPVLARENAQSGGDWSLVTRTDGKQQWAFRGKPLYASFRDQKPGNTFGDGTANQWYVAIKPIPLPPAVEIGRSALGHVLTDGRGRTLYTSDADPAGKSTCDARCSAIWKAVRAPWTARPDAAKDWLVIVNKDGTRQWGFKGKAVYTYDRDVRPGDIYGQGIDGHKVVLLQPLPPNPPWVTYHPSDSGVLIADENNATLYMLDETRRNGVKSGIQRPREWKPVIAKPDAVPVGNWGVIESNGLRQWTYKGMLVYTNMLDIRPGQLHGVRSTDALWRTIMRSGEVMEGAGP